MSQFQQNLFCCLLVLLLLITACQPPTNQGELQPTAATVISQESLLPPASTTTPTDTPVSQPTPTLFPTATPGSSSASQGDQLPTHIPPSLPTPTAIPTGEAALTPTDISVPLPTETLLQSEIDLPTLDESLALLDRLDRREEESAPTPAGPMVYEGVASWVEIPETCACAAACEQDLFTVRVLIDESGNVTGILEILTRYGKSEEVWGLKALEFAGSRDFVTGTSTHPGMVIHSDLTARLINNDKLFEGAIEILFSAVSGSEPCSRGRWTFSLARK